MWSESLADAKRAKSVANFKVEKLVLETWKSFHDLRTEKREKIEKMKRRCEGDEVRTDFRLQSTVQTVSDRWYLTSSSFSASIFLPQLRLHFQRWRFSCEQTLLAQEKHQAMEKVQVLKHFNKFFMFLKVDIFLGKNEKKRHQMLIAAAFRGWRDTVSGEES